MKVSTIIPWLLAAGLVGGVCAATAQVPLRVGPVPPVAPPVPGPVTAPVVSGNGAQIQFAEPSFSFGKVAAGSEVKHDFEFVNTGDQVLEIRSVQTSCGCTTAADYERSIAPGARGRIPVILRTTGFTGPLHKTITVNSTAVREPTVVLQLTGEAWVPVAVSPPYLYFPQVTGGAPAAARTARITSNVESPLHILSTQVEPDSFKAVLRTVEEGKVFELEVTPVGEFKPGATQGLVRLETNQKDSPELQVKLYLNVLEAVVVTPKHLILPAGNLPAATKRYVSIRSSDNTPLVVKSVEVPGFADVATSFTETIPGKMFRVEATFPEGFLLEQGQSPKLLVHTDRADYEELEVPVVQPVRSSVIRPRAPVTVRAPASVAPLAPVPEPTPRVSIPATPVPELRPIPPGAGSESLPPVPPIPPRSR
ncbi:MAG: DUF1573 domain-containing protein [Verrucomicrobiales bacterium]|nr:DUF1573 domain-containing protein [Verrucomicrobiales bacterium]